MPLFKGCQLWTDWYMNNNFKGIVGISEGYNILFYVWWYPNNHAAGKCDMYIVIINL